MNRHIRFFVSGALSPLTGLILIIRNPTLLRLSILPFLIGLLVFIVGIAIGLPFITSLVAPFAHEMILIFGIKASSSAGEWILWFLPFFLWPSLALMLIYILLNLARFIAAPLYGFLAAKVLKLAGFPTVRGAGLREAAAKTAVLVVIGLILGVLSFIPGLAVFTGPIFLILLSYDILDYSFEVLGWNLDRRFSFFRSHFAVFLGMGVSLGLLFLVPGLGFFVLPSAVAGAANLVSRIAK